MEEKSNLSVREITISGVLDSLKSLPKVKENISKVSQLIISGEYKLAMELFLESLEWINWFNKILQGVEVIIGVKMEEVKEGDISLADTQRELKNILENLVFSFKEKNWVEISDILEYQLVPNLEIWIRGVPELIKILDKKLN
jgi:hypothetical protein